jgi:hypothetical protein
VRLGEGIDRTGEESSGQKGCDQKETGEKNCRKETGGKESHLKEGLSADLKSLWKDRPGKRPAFSVLYSANPKQRT